MPIRGLLPTFSCFLLFWSAGTFGQVAEVTNVPFHAPVVNGAQSLPDSGVIQQVSGTTDPGSVVPAAATGTIDPKLGHRLARISANHPNDKIPNQHGQIWREYDLSPYTKGRTFPPGSNPSQTVVEWILRHPLLGPKVWHSAPFGFLTADEDKLYVYHTVENQRLIADIVDRFVNQQAFNESYSIRIVTLSRPDWMTKGHAYLRPIPIRSPGVQGWILEKEGTQHLFQELSRRNDFVELVLPQAGIPNGIAHRKETYRQRTYLRDVQPNPSALNGYAEDRVTIDEGFGVTFIPLASLDGQTVDAIIKLDITQIEKMIPLMIDVPTQTNPRQRIQIESPQVACFRLDEQIRWPKSKVLLLDLGTVPVPPRQQSETADVIAKVKALGQQSNRANILLFIERIGNLPSPIMPASSGNPQNGAAQSPSVGAASPYWQNVR